MLRGPVPLSSPASESPLMSRVLIPVLFILALIAVVPQPLSADDADKAASLELLSVERIWDKAPHNAFTDLIRYNDRWVCAFREAPAHKGGVRDSRIRVIASKDLKQWESVGELSDPRGDIRDAKLAILADGRLLLLTATQLFDSPGGQTHQSIAFSTPDLTTWDGPVDVGDPNRWLWGIKMHKGIGYTLGYGTGDKKGTMQLYRTSNGTDFEAVGESFKVEAPYPNESAILFDDDDTMHVLLRCDPDPALLGTSSPPYTRIEFKPTSLRVGGPALTRAPDGRVFAGGRDWNPTARTVILGVDLGAAQLTELLELPSGGDTSYPGFVWHDGVLHMSYYSSHEGGKSCIYLARVRVPQSDR